MFYGSLVIEARLISGGRTYRQLRRCHGQPPPRLYQFFSPMEAWHPIPRPPQDNSSPSGHRTTPTSLSGVWPHGRSTSSAVSYSLQRGFILAHPHTAYILGQTEIARAMSDLELANIVGIYTYIHLIETGIKNTPTTRFTYTSM